MAPDAACPVITLASLELGNRVIDGFYNPRRIQKRLGYLSPIEYEEKHYSDQAAAEQVNLKPRQPVLTS